MSKIYAEKNGVFIIYDETENWNYWQAIVNGKRYSCRDCRPIDGEGRQLKEENRQTIRELFPIAKEAKEAEEEELKEGLQAEINAKAAEIAKNSTPQKSFAEALEESFLNTLAQNNAEAMIEKILPTVREKITAEYGILPQVIEIREEAKQPRKIEGVFHAEFNEMLNDVIHNIPLYLAGPAGTGKSFIAMQIAEALDLDFYCANAVTDTVTLTGFMDANSRFNETEFYKAFTKGGVFLLDEIDASIPEVLVLLNNALANKVFPFPNGKVKASPDFHVIATGNTYGTGGDDVYTGRYQIDGATLDRFSFYEVNYDERIENTLAENDDELINFIHSFRKAVKKAGVNCLATYRAISRLHEMSGYKAKDKAIKQGLTKGLENDDLTIIYNNMDDCTLDNRWKAAFSKLIIPSISF